MHPREYQIEAIERVVSGLQYADRGQMIMACGSGKTATTFWIKERLEANMTLFIVPCLSLITQAIHEWQSAGKQTINFLCVCSDYTVIERQEYEVSTDNQHPVSSSVDDIARFMQQHHKRVLFVTYQSIPLVMDAQKITNIDFCYITHF